MDAIRIATPEDFCLGTIAVVKEDCLLPSRWRFDRITEMLQGKDGVTKIISIRTATEVVKRLMANICILPMNNEHPTPRAGFRDLSDRRSQNKLNNIQSYVFKHIHGDAHKVIYYITIVINYIANS